MRQIKNKIHDSKPELFTLASADIILNLGIASHVNVYKISRIKGHIIQQITREIRRKYTGPGRKDEKL